MPIDEPHESAPAYEPMFISWSRAVKQAAPELKIWVDPYYVDPTNMPAEMIELADAVCPLLGQMFREGEAFEAFYRDLQSTGKRLEFYVINTVTGDPYTGFRLPAWWAFSMNAQAVSYWSFSDTGGGEGNSWNQYAARRTAYAPMFVSHDSVTPGKHMEAIREGVQDFEYLVMLRDRITALTAAGATHPQLPRARALLEDAPARVIRAGGAQETKWSAPKDRSIADTVRIEIARILETTAE